MWRRGRESNPHKSPRQGDTLPICHRAKFRSEYLSFLVVAPSLELLPYAGKILLQLILCARLSSREALLDYH